MIAQSISRQGGIQEVCRQVEGILAHDNPSKYRHILFKGRFHQRVPKFIKILYYMLTGYTPVVMHPFIFERLIFIKNLPVIRNRPWVVWAYGIDVWGNFGRFRASHLGHAALIIAISEFTKSRVLENFPDSRVRVVSLAIDNSLVREKASAENHAGQESKAPEILTVSRLSSDESYKGHDLVIEALTILEHRGLSVTYHVVGSGDDVDRLKKLAVQNGVADRVIFHGYVADKDIDDIYERCSVFVMPSYVRRSDTDIWGGEGFGLVYLEAGIRGLPVIACDEGGQTDCVFHDETGFLVRPDPEEIAGKLETVLRDEELRQQMGNRAKHVVSTQFTLDQFRRDLLQALQEL